MTRHLGDGAGRVLSPRRRRAAASVVAGAALVWACVAAADVGVRATAHPQRGQVGDTITLAIEITGTQEAPPAPALSLPAFDARYLGPSTQVSIVNGAVDARVQHRYALTARQAGHHTLGPFTIEHGGRRFQTEPVAVDISVAAAQPAPGGSLPKGAREPLQLTLSVPRHEVFLHERLPIDVTLYVGQMRVGDVQYPTLAADGLSVDKFPEPSQRRETIDGQPFTVLGFHTEAVPLRTGALQLGPAAVNLSVYERRRGRVTDPFFDQFLQQTRPTTLRSEPLTLTVLPLPEDGKPATFSGAVGSFTMTVDALPTEVTAGDPITLRMRLSGTGNLADSGPPVLSDPHAFRTYEPRAGKLEVAPAGAVSRSFEQVLIPSDPAVRAIAPVRFSYFDPVARRYQTLESAPIALLVRAPHETPRTDIVAAPGSNQAARPAEERLGRDILYIKDDPGTLRPPGVGWYWVFLAWQPLPTLLLLAAVWYDRRRTRLTGDVRYARFTRAGRTAQRALAAVAHTLRNGEHQAAYDAVAGTIRDYLGAKLDLPPGGVDLAAVRARGVDTGTLEQIRQLLDLCERARFAPGADRGEISEAVGLAHSIVRRLERSVRFTPVAA